MRHPVIVVGGGISGVACARELLAAGVPVRVVDRGSRLGGRMAVRTERLGDRERPVDVGAAYFTVRDPGFAELVAEWEAEGLARPWGDAFHLLGPDAEPQLSDGVTRWSAPGGLQSLVEHLARGLDVDLAHEVEEVGCAGGRLSVDGVPAAAVVLAMPEPQAYDLLPEPIADSLDLGSGLDWSPSIAVWAGWERPWWPQFGGAYVDGSAVVSWVADDGRRRGDGAAVLVAHTTAVFADARLEDPEAAIAPVLAELAELLARLPGPRPGAGGAPPAPVFARAQRWSLAAPRHPHRARWALHPDLIGVCGDAWGPRARIEQAWRSGRELGSELRQRLCPDAAAAPGRPVAEDPRDRP